MGNRVGKRKRSSVDRREITEDVYTTSKQRTKGNEEKKEEVIALVKERLRKTIRKIKAENEKKVELAKEKAAESNQIMETAIKAIESQQPPSMELLRAIISNAEQFVMGDESSMNDTRDLKSQIMGLTNRSIRSSSDHSDIMDALNIQEVNKDTKALMDVVSQQKTLLNFYAMLSGLQISLKNDKSGESGEGCYESAYEKSSFSEFSCTFIPAVLNQMKGTGVESYGTFLLRYNRDQGEVEYVPWPHPSSSSSSARSNNLKHHSHHLQPKHEDATLEVLSSRCYFEEAKAMNFLYVLLERFLRHIP